MTVHARRLELGIYFEILETIDKLGSQFQFNNFKNYPEIEHSSCTEVFPLVREKKEKKTSLLGFINSNLIEETGVQCFQVQI